MPTKQGTFTTVLAVATFLFGALAVIPLIAQKAPPRTRDKVLPGSRADFRAFLQKEFERSTRTRAAKADPRGLPAGRTPQP